MGYFRILYYISYIFNTIMRILRRNKKFIFILIVIALIFIILNNETQAVYIGNDTYTDSQNNIINAYEGVTLDFIRRYDLYKKKFPNSSVLAQVDGYLNALNYRSFYIYYKDKNGSAMLNGAPLQQSTMYLLVYQNTSNFPFSPTATYSDYLGNEADIKMASPVGTQSFIYTVFELSAQNSENSLRLVDNVANEKFYIPSVLINYYTSDFVNYFYNNYSLQQIEAINEINNNLETITDDTVTQDTTDTTEDVLEDSESIFDNTFTNDLTTYNNTFLQTIMAPINSLVDGTTIKRVSFTLPYVNYTYTLRGDALSSKIRNTDIYTYVQLFWWFAFSVPIFTLLRRILLWLGTGEFINKPSKFALYMSNFVSNNITPGMM